MPIPESQLETWSHQGSIQQSSTTYNGIKNTLEANDTPYYSKSFKTFLQGSYGNYTNIYSESDVDVVIVLEDCWQSDLSKLSDDEKTAYDKAFVSAQYGHVEFKADVLKVLKDKYGADVTEGDKALTIAANGNRRKADVIAAIRFRRYYKFNGTNDQSYDEGICFYNGKNERIANYPKQHSENMTTKHQDASKRLKPMVRVLKNLREKLVDDGLLATGVAPSYYIEGLLYNVPSDKFSSNYQETFVDALTWIQTEATKTDLVCANEQYYLLRDGVHTCWKPEDCETFLEAATTLWNDW